MGLNIQQLEAKAKIEKFIKKGSGFFGLLGAGGTGKTYLITSLNDSENYQYLAPTNKAVNILRKGLYRNGVLKPKVKTIDSFFRLKMKKNENNETIYSYTQPLENQLPKVIIVDECSLMSKKHIDLLLNLKKPIPIILLGDEMQLPPIEKDHKSDFIDDDGFKKSIAFNVIDEKYTLTIQNRQSESSDLFKLINGFRKNMGVKMSCRKVAELKNNGVDIIYTHQNSHFLTKFIKENECVSVGFKNNTCDYFNYKIGSTITNDKNYNIREVNKGDLLMFDKFYKKDDVVFYTSEIVKVVDLIEENVTIKIPKMENEIVFLQPKAIVKNEIGIDKTIWLKNADLRKLVYSVYYRAKNQTTDKTYIAELNTFYADFMNGFANLKKPHAITAHKSQGSTYKNIIIPVYDFYKKSYKDANQLVYVAMSRSSEKIIFVDGHCNFSNTTQRVMFKEDERCLIASIQDWKCNACDTDLFDGRYEIDHIQRLGYKDDKGNLVGTNTISNLQAICKNCHKNKTKHETKKRKI